MLNPILRREAQTSLRSWKIFGVIAAYVGIIVLFAVVFIKTAMSGSIYYGFDPQDIVYLYALPFGVTVWTDFNNGSCSYSRKYQR